MNELDKSLSWVDQSKKLVNKIDMTKGIQHLKLNYSYLFACEFEWHFIKSELICLRHAWLDNPDSAFVEMEGVVIAGARTRWEYM